MGHLLDNVEQLEAYRDRLFGAWATLKDGLKKDIRNI
jgi:hypothetical protein